MSQPQPQNIQLPAIIKFIMPAQHAVVLLSALENHGPYKDVNAVFTNLQQQLLGQQIVAPAAPAVEPPPLTVEPQYPVGTTSAV